MPVVKRVIDLSHPIYHDMPGWPGIPRAQITRIFTIPMHGANVFELKLHTHAGTHMDAPLHFEDYGKTLDEIPLEDLMGEATIVDLTYIKPKHGITASDLEEHGKHVKEGDIVILNTGWYKKRGINCDYQLNYPHLTKESAEWLVNRKVKAVGIDTVAVDMWGSKDFPAHHTLFRADIYVIEELTNLDKIEGNRFFISIMPLNITGVEASPARVTVIEFK